MRLPSFQQQSYGFQLICLFCLKRLGYSEQEALGILAGINFAKLSPAIYASQLSQHLNRCTKDPLTCIKLAMSTHTDDYGDLGQLIHQAQNIEEALQLFFHYQSVFTGDFHYTLHTQDLVSIELTPGEPLGDIECSDLLEFRSAMLIRVIHYLTGETEAVSQLFSHIEFTHEAKSSSDQYMQATGIPVYNRAAANRIYLYPEVIHQKIPLSDPCLKQVFLGKLQKSYAAHLQNLPIAQRTKLYIRDKIQFSDVSLKEMANDMNTSVSTLKRHLAKAGHSYQKIYDQTRLEIARELLEETDVSIKQITEKLRYSRTSSFSRSFKSLTGLTPQHYRSQYGK